MKYPRKEKLEQLKGWERNSYLQKNIKFSWFIDEHSLLDAIIKLDLYHSKSDYLVDDDFERYVFKDVTFTQAIFISNQLWNDAIEVEKERCKKFKVKFDASKVWCSKHNYIKSVLLREKRDRFWIEYPGCLLSYARRIQCGCHESGSFSKRKD